MLSYVIVLCLLDYILLQFEKVINIPKYVKEIISLWYEYYHLIFNFTG